MSLPCPLGDQCVCIRGRSGHAMCIMIAAWCSACTLIPGMPPGEGFLWRRFESRMLLPLLLLSLLAVGCTQTGRFCGGVCVCVYAKVAIPHEDAESRVASAGGCGSCDHALERVRVNDGKCYCTRRAVTKGRRLGSGFSAQSTEDVFGNSHAEAETVLSIHMSVGDNCFQLQIEKIKLWSPPQNLR